MNCVETLASGALEHFSSHGAPQLCSTMKPFLTSALPSLRTDSRPRYRDPIRSIMTSVIVPLTVALQPTRVSEIVFTARIVPWNSLMPMRVSDVTSPFSEDAKTMCWLVGPDGNRQSVAHSPNIPSSLKASLSLAVAADVRPSDAAAETAISLFHISPSLRLGSSALAIVGGNSDAARGS